MERLSCCSQFCLDRFTQFVYITYMKCKKKLSQINLYSKHNQICFLSNSPLVISLKEFNILCSVTSQKKNDCVIEDVFDSRHIMTFCYKITNLCSYLYRLLSCNSTLITFISISINSMIHSSPKEVVILQTGPF